MKQAEDSDEWLLRIYEAHGARGPVRITFDREIAGATECDLMEENDQPVAVAGRKLVSHIKPYEIKPFKVTLR